MRAQILGLCQFEYSHTKISTIEVYVGRGYGVLGLIESKEFGLEVR